VTARVITLKGFFEEARAGRLTGLRCGECGELAIPPKEFCPACGKRAWTPVPLEGMGVVASYTVIRVPPRSHTGQAPYAVAVVRLAEGVSLTGRVVDIPLDSLRVGLPVKFQPIVSADETLVAFGPV
jgi:hypothetical protein